MPLCHCVIELKDPVSAGSFSEALQAWLALLESRGLIQDWWLYQRRSGFGRSAAGDLVLEVRMRSPRRLAAAFRAWGRRHEAEAERLYDFVHGMIGRAEDGLRPPGLHRVERLALV